MNDRTDAPSVPCPYPPRDTALNSQLIDRNSRAVLDAAPYAIIIQREGVFLYANTAALELFGASSFDLLASHRLADLVHDDDRAHFTRNILHPPDCEGTIQCEIRCVRLDGDPIWTEAMCVQITLDGERAMEIVLRDITKRRGNEERIRMQALVMEGINRILRASLEFESEEELGRACLEVAEEITHSTSGFIGELRSNGLEKISLSLQEDGVTISRTMIPIGKDESDAHRLFSQALDEGKSFYTNDPPYSSETATAAVGHPTIESFLGVPLIHEGRTEGMVGLANKPGGYTHVEQEFVEALAPAIVGAFVRHRMETEMQHLYAQTRRDAVTKTDLLNEINHRVKNNLMTILGLILAEKRHMPSRQLELTMHIWEKFELRIAGLLKVHQILSDSQWTPMNISGLALHICSGIIESFGMADKVALSIADSAIDVTPRQANNIALIFNELTTNSLKYAFTRTAHPRIEISIYNDHDSACIEFRDNGSGYAPDVLAQGNHHVGLKLVQHLVEDTLDGDVQLLNDGGSVTRLRIRIEEPAKNAALRKS